MNRQRAVKKEHDWFKSMFDICEESPAKKICLDTSNDKKSSPEALHNFIDLTLEINEKKYDIKELASQDWINKFAPNNVSELAVNSKKVKELEEWMVRSLKDYQFSNGMLLLTGPSGCGKTAAVNVMIKHLGARISEWITPVDVEYTREMGNTQIVYQERQSEKFAEFLLKASRYPSLLAQNVSRIIVVEDFPNIFLKEPSQFVSVLERYQNHGRSPLIFVCSETNSGSLNMIYNLFPPAVLERFKIDQISFNPINATNMKAALKRITTIMNKKFSSVYKIPDQDCVDSVINSSTGDIRSAINNLHFASLKGSFASKLQNCVPKNSKATKGKKKKVSGPKLKSMGKDEIVTIMHGVGRVLNPKFIEKNNPDERDEYVHSPSGIAEQFQMQSSSFIGYIHENYLPHFANIDYVEKAIDALSDADCLVNDWKEKDSKMYGLLVAISGVMISNKSPVSSWHPIKGSKYKKISYPDPKTTPLIDQSQLIQGKVLATDFKTYCEIIKSAVTKEHSHIVDEEDFFIE